MIRQSLLALAAVAVLGTGALTPNTAAAAWRGWHRDAIEDRFEHRFFVRHPIAFRRFAFADVDGCVGIRRAWTPWGWSWRRIWVCG
jgi:hypothetical protein